MQAFNSLGRFAPHLLGVLRIMTALTFISHGTQKILGFPLPNPLPPLWSMPAAFTLSWTAGILELIGGTLVLIGFPTRPAAFVLSGLMACAYWMSHGPKSLYPLLNGGEPALLFCFIFLYIAAAGPGAFALESRKA